MALKAAWSGLHGLSSDLGAKMLKVKANAKGVHHQSGVLPASDQRQKEGLVRSGSQKSGDDEVRQLRKRLSREVNIHKILERAFGRPIGFLPHLPNYLPPKTQKLLAEVAVLEEEVVQLEDGVFSLQQELEVKSHNSAEFIKQIHGSSCPPATWSRKTPLFLSPQRKQQIPADSFRVKKDVIIAKLLNSPLVPSTETSSKLHSDLQIRTVMPNKNLSKDDAAVSPRIAVKNRELIMSPRIHAASSPPGHVLLNCKDASSTGRFSPVRPTECRKQNQHQSIGSFFSHWPQSSKAKTKITNSPEAFSQPSTQKMKRTGSISDLKPCGMLNFEIDTELNKRPEPNKLSEEMMKCLLRIYCIMTRPCLMSEYDTSSMVSRSTFSSFNLQTYASKSTLSSKTGSEISFESDRADPYAVCGESPRDIGPYKNFPNITAKSFDYRRIQDSASMLRRLRVMVGTLGTIDLKGMSHQQKLAFWINIYNVCMMHGFLEYGIPGSPHQVMALMHKAVLNVGGYLVNALDIEHFILRLPCHSKHAFANITSKENVSIQSALGLEWPEPLVSFALCCGSQSSPAVRVYTSSKIENELEIAKKEYLQAVIGITKRNKVLIPKLLDWNSCNFAKDTESFMDWICKQIPVPLQKAVQECMLTLFWTYPLFKGHNSVKFSPN